jgi:hypothetical protein
MNPDSKMLQDSVFLFRRTQDADFSNWVIALPVAFAVLVAVIVTVFRHEGKRRMFLWSALVVGTGSAVYVPLAFVLKPLFSWWVILVPCLALGLAYVALMYRRDSQSVHPLWASFLGILRCLVYGILAFVFLLPGCQLFDTTETQFKSLLLLDVSGSMGVVDDLPEEGQDPSKLDTRIEKVVKFLTGDLDKSKTNQTSFMDRLLQKTPVSVYRFGSQIDASHVMHLNEGQRNMAEEWRAFLKLDKRKIKVPEKLSPEEQSKERARLQELFDSLLNGTNVVGSALQAAKLETGSLLQSIIIVSDGQSNQGGDDALKEFVARVESKKRPVHVFTIGVGEFRQPVSVRIYDLQAPEVARPDDKFPVRVPVVGSGLADQDFEVTLEAQRIKDREGKELAGEKRFVLGPKRAKFKGGGDNPMEQVEFEIDVQELKKIRADKDEAGGLEGTWEFIARVPRHKNEAFAKPEHVSDATHVLVQKRKLRVLLFAGGPTRDFQFVRTLFYREVVEKRVDLAIYLQTAREDNVDQDVEKEWLLDHFPDRLGPNVAGQKHYSLSDYDVIIAFDPDWTALEPRQLQLLKDWVGNHGGGIIFVVDPVNAYTLARPAGFDITPLLTIFPVVLKDSRLHGLGIGHDPGRPYALHFTPAAKLFEFLKLDDAGVTPTAGWDHFFWRNQKPEPGKQPLRGFHNYYPVEKIKPDSIVVATFAGPVASRINDGKDEQPYLVAMRYGSGKTFYIGSGETWRLRQTKTAYFERFWIKLARYVSAGTSMQKKYGLIPLARRAVTGTITFEAQLKGTDMQFLPSDAAPTVQVKRPVDFDPKLDPETPESFELRPKNTQGEWNGWFVGTFKVRTPGDYEFRIPIPGVPDSDWPSHRMNIRQPNLEMDNVRNNFKDLYRLASDATPLLNNVNLEMRKELEKWLKPPEDVEVHELSAEGKDVKRLFFALKDADSVPKFLRKLGPKRESTKGKLLDLWDDGFGRQEVFDPPEVSAYYLFLLFPLAIGLLAATVLLFTQRPVAAGVTIGAAALMATLVCLIDLFAALSWADVPIDMSFALASIAFLLCLEWLTRKLLKLA